VRAALGVDLVEHDVDGLANGIGGVGVSSSPMPFSSPSWSRNSCSALIVTVRRCASPLLAAPVTCPDH
jgi:hypothetical protein